LKADAKIDSRFPEERFSSFVSLMSLFTGHVRAQDALMMESGINIDGSSARPHHRSP
jgi:hypothetical protein